LNEKGIYEFIEFSVGFDTGDYDCHSNLWGDSIFSIQSQREEKKEGSWCRNKKLRRDLKGGGK
jgi:hypothetical protein